MHFLQLFQAHVSSYIGATFFYNVLFIFSTNFFIDKIPLAAQKRSKVMVLRAANIMPFVTDQLMRSLSKAVTLQRPRFD